MNMLERPWRMDTLHCRKNKQWYWSRKWHFICGNHINHIFTLKKNVKIFFYKKNQPVLLGQVLPPSYLLFILTVKSLRMVNYVTTKLDCKLPDSLDGVANALFDTSTHAEWVLSEFKQTRRKPVWYYFLKICNLKYYS